MVSALHRHILLGIETDPTLYHGENARRPALLDSSHTATVLAHIATDLHEVLPATGKCTLSMAGTLFDQAQVLQPGLPVFGALESLWQTNASGEQPRMAFGVEDQQMPHPELQPDADILPGPLQLLPMLLSCPGDDDVVGSMDLDRQFTEHGQLSRASVNSLEKHFNIAIRHTRFMSVAHLGKLLRRQLEHYGFLPLWELLDAAMNPPDGPLEVHTAQGARFRWQDGVVHGFFETFDWWAKRGAGVSATASGQRLQAAYAEWVRGYRRYQTVLASHGVELVQHLPGLEDAVLEGSFLLEESAATPAPDAVSVTEHSAGEMGVVAVTVVNGRRQMNFYPLGPAGVNELHRYIHKHGLGGDTAYPGHICYDEKTRQLMAETLPS
jgi:hypothetical protein